MNVLMQSVKTYSISLLGMTLMCHLLREANSFMERYTIKPGRMFFQNVFLVYYLVLGIPINNIKREVE